MSRRHEITPRESLIGGGPLAAMAAGLQLDRPWPWIAFSTLLAGQLGRLAWPLSDRRSARAEDGGT